MSRIHGCRRIVSLFCRRGLAGGVTGGLQDAWPCREYIYARRGGEYTLPCRRASYGPAYLPFLLIVLIVLPSLAVSVHAASAPDLTVDSIWLEDASQVGQPVSQVSPGQSFNIVATIKNIGQETASGYYLDVYYDSDYGRGGPDNIAPGEVQTWYVGPLTAQAGTHTTKWVVDPDNQIAELNESNNQKELEFTVGSQTTNTTTTVTVTTSSNSTSTSTSQTTMTTTTSSTTTSTLSSTTSSASTSTSLPATHALGWLPENIPKDARVTPVVSAAPPTHFDWTQKDGQNWMTSVKDQGGCGSCVAFAAVGAFEGQLKIQTNNPSWNIDLSEQHLFSCSGGTCSGGETISVALNYLQQYGTPDEACSPYQGGSGSGSCSNSCPDWQSRASKISSWNWIANNPSAVEAALMNGPLIAGFTVYADFYYAYNGGVYHWDHVSQAVGGHAIVIVGYDQPGQYWIVKNSWGSSWGEKGYFRIGFGEAGIENYVASVRASAALLPVLLSPADGATGVSLTTTLSWQVVSGADAYQVAVYDGANLVLVGYSGSGSYAVPSGKLVSGRTYTWYVWAHNAIGWSNPSAEFSLTTSGSSVPAAPVLLSPSDGATGVALAPTLSWQVVSGADAYQIAVYDGASLVLVGYSGSGSYTVPSGKLVSGRTYTWLVWAHNAIGWSNPSAVWSFASGGSVPVAPVLLSPANGASGVSLTPTLTWNAVSGADAFQIAIYEGSTLIHVGYSASTHYSVPSGALVSGHTYTWVVWAHNGAGWSNPSIWSFTT